MNQKHYDDIDVSDLRNHPFIKRAVTDKEAGFDPKCFVLLNCLYWNVLKVPNENNVLLDCVIDPRCQEFITNPSQDMRTNPPSNNLPSNNSPSKRARPLTSEE